MREKLTAKFLMSFLIGLLVAVAATGMAIAPKCHNKEEPVANQSPEAGFTLTRLPENARQYSLIISGAEERSISGTFSVEQLQILTAIMVEAEKFAVGAEAVGTKDPITTRFMDKQERAFIVDVQKAGNQSVLFLTLKTELGRMTVEAGRTIRATRREEGFFFDLLSRLESTLPKAQPR
jgi:hypothetical protein